MKHKLSILSIVILAAVIIGIPMVKAEQSYFSIASSALATSTITQMTPGTATTTYVLSASFGNALAGVDKSNIFVQITASSTGTILNWIYQYSNNGLDWFNYDTPLTPANPSTNFVYSSSTALVYVFQANSTTASTTGIVVNVPDVASLYKRVVFTMPAGSANGQIWLQDTEKYNAQGGN